MTFFMVGFVVTQVFFSKIIFRIKFPIYIVSSLVVSTFLIYIVAMFFGLNRNVVLITFTPFLPLSLYFTYKLRADFLDYFKSNLKGLLVIFFIITIYFIALYPAILGRKDNYLVMSGVNWQDTALHLSITQSLSQGNFPPQAPYFSGAPLSYYYFTDLHSAIIGVAYNRFFPRVFVYDNALLAGVLALSLYSLAFEISKNRKLAMLSSFIGSFYGSLIFYKFFQEIINGGKIREILANNIYSMEYQKLFGMANMADYYLQNRPMMIGLPVVIITILLIINGFKKEKLATLLLGGLLTASLVKIQFFCILAGVVAFIILSISCLKKSKLKFLFKSSILFFIPILLFYLLFGIKSVNGLELVDLIKNTFRFGPWDSSKDFIWKIEFVFLNFGFPFIVTIASLLSKLRKDYKLISVAALIFVIIPFLVTFTIDGADMFKFFYFAIMLFAVITPFALRNILKNELGFRILITLIVVITTSASILTLGNSFYNKNLGYSLPDYNAGLWIRENTPQKSVFVTTTSIHSAPTDLAGRLRVISYTNWPYTHGFTTGSDNVFSRAEDVKLVYDTGDIDNIKLKYKTNYVFYGGEESSQFPDAWRLFDTNKNLKLIYSQDNIKIYEII